MKDIQRSLINNQSITSLAAIMCNTCIMQKHFYPNISCRCVLQGSSVLLLNKYWVIGEELYRVSRET